MSERLWAGWRMAYIREAGGTGGSEGCLFCGLAAAGISPETLVLERYRHALLVLNAFPYTTGHLMVAPYTHTESLLLADRDARAEVQAALERARRALAAAYRPDGFNLGVNLGRPAGAGVLGHVHWHVVPRWSGDTNFVPVLTGVRVIPEALPETFARLAESLAGLPPEGVEIQGGRDA